MSIRRTRIALVPTVLLLFMVVFAVAARAQSVTLVAAGSLNLALSQVADAFTAATGIKVAQTYSPSGTLRQQIESGLRPDVFASADTNSPQTLQQEGLAGPVQVFASNQNVVVVRSGFGQAVNPSNLLSVLLDSSTRIGTSTPVADPGGDYAQEIFQKADAVQAGATATLQAKAQELVANANAPAVPAGTNSLVYFLDTTQTVDVFISYVTSCGAGPCARSRAAHRISAARTVGGSTIRADGTQWRILRGAAVRRFYFVSEGTADTGELRIYPGLPDVGAESVS